MSKKPSAAELRDMIAQSGTINLNDSIQKMLDQAEANTQKGDFNTQGYVLVSEDYVLVTSPKDDEVQ